MPIKTNKFKNININENNNIKSVYSKNNEDNTTIINYKNSIDDINDINDNDINDDDINDNDINDDDINDNDINDDINDDDISDDDINDDTNDINKKNDISAENDINGSNLKSNDFLKELLINQIKNINPNKKLNYGDIKRISKFLVSSIFSENTCCIWNGYVTNEKNQSKGTYINFYFNKKKIALHRLLYINYIGEISNKEYIRFTCDNKGKCCNINHMKKYSYNRNIIKINNNNNNINSNNINISYTTNDLTVEF